MQPNQTMYDDQGQQVALFPLTRFLYFSTVVAEHIRMKVVKGTTQLILFLLTITAIDYIDSHVMHHVQ